MRRVLQGLRLGSGKGVARLVCIGFPGDRWRVVNIGHKRGNERTMVQVGMSIVCMVRCQCLGSSLAMPI